MPGRSVAVLFLIAVLAAVLLVRGSAGHHEHASGATNRAAAPRVAIAKVYNDRTAGISVIGADGSRLVTLTRHSGWVDDGPAWSPDGRRIAFARTTNGHRSIHLFVMRADGSGIHRITGGRFDERPAWSPNGKWILFQSSAGLQLVRPGGAQRRRIAGTKTAAWPAWAPGGDRIAFTQGGFIWTARPSGGDRRRIVAGREPDWSPTGGRLAFTLPNGGIATIPAASPEGAGHYLGKGLQPDWAPSGQSIAYTRWPPGLRYSVWVMGQDGTGSHRLIEDARAPDWQP